MNTEDELSAISEHVLRIIEEFRDSDIEVMHVKQGEFEIMLSRRSDIDLIATNHVGTMPFAQSAQASASEDPVTRDAARLAEATGADATVPPAPSTAKGADPERSTEHNFVVTAPMVGMVYLAPEPGSPPFVTAGQEVTESDTVALIEAMKLFTAVPATQEGTIVEVYVEDGAFVEYGQDILEIRSDAVRG